MQVTLSAVCGSKNTPLIATQGICDCAHLIDELFLTGVRVIEYVLSIALIVLGFHWFGNVQVGWFGNEFVTIVLFPFANVTVIFIPYVELSIAYCWV